MSYATQLSEEIHRVLDRLEGQGAEWRASFITEQIVRNHSEALTDDDRSLFWRHCGYAETRREVTRCINTRAGDRPTEKPSEQIALPGYEHLQRYYVVTRDEEDVGVAVDQLTDMEIEAKVSRYRAMGRACFAHADELVRYRAKRRRPSA